MISSYSGGLVKIRVRGWRRFREGIGDWREGDRRVAPSILTEIVVLVQPWRQASSNASEALYSIIWLRDIATVSHWWESNRMKRLLKWLCKTVDCHSPMSWRSSTKMTSSAQWSSGCRRRLGILAILSRHALENQNNRCKSSANRLSKRSFPDYFGHWRHVEGQFSLDSFTEIYMVYSDFSTNAK